MNKLDKKLQKDKSTAAEYYNRTAKTTKPINVGSSVRIQNPKDKVWDAMGKVVGVGRNRDYLVKLPSGRIIWRNKRYIKIIENNIEN